MTIKAGDKIKVVKKHFGFEPYSVGDVFTVSEIDEANYYGDVRLISVEGHDHEYMMFDTEVELYEEEEATEADTMYEDIVEGLSQAIADKAAQMEAEKVEEDLFDTIDALSMAVKQSIDIASCFPPSVGFGEGEHGMNTGGKRTPADAVNSPSHYTQGGIEVIDIIAQTVSGYDDGFTAHCVGTATKYLNRAPHKHETPLEDLEKAAKYLEFAIANEKKKRN